MNTPAIPPRLGISIAVVAFAFPAIFIRLADADPLAIAFLRLFFAALILWPLSLNKAVSAWKLMNRKDRWRVIAAGVFLGVHMFLWVTAVTKTTIASASFLIITQPLIVAVLAHFLMGEKINRWASYAIVLTLFGVGVINGGDLELGPEYLWGDFLALLGAIMAAFYLLVGRSVRPRVELLSYITIVYTFSALVLLPICILAGTPLFSLTGKAYFWIIMLTLIPTLIGHSLYNWALRYLKAFTVNISIVVEPLGATAMAWFFFREQPSRMFYLGAFLLVLALFLAFKGEEA